MSERLFQDQESLAAVCRKHAIRRLSLFGSVLKGTAGLTATSICWWSSSLDWSPACSVWRRSKRSCRTFREGAGLIYARQPISAVTSAAK